MNFQCNGRRSSLRLPLSDGARISSHCAAGKCGASTLACRVGTPADARCLRPAEASSCDCTQKCVRHDSTCEVILALPRRCWNRRLRRSPAVLLASAANRQTHSQLYFCALYAARLRHSQLPPRHDIIVLAWTLTSTCCGSAIWGKSARLPPSSRCAAPSPDCGDAPVPRKCPCDDDYIVARGELRMAKARRVESAEIKPRVGLAIGRRREQHGRRSA